MLSSHTAMDEMCDLDLALTMPEYSAVDPNRHHPDAESTAAARHLVDEMPTVVMGGDAHCTVCMEGFRLDDGAAKQVPCGHVFHDSCISRWLAIHSSCPMCRGKISGGSGQVVF